MTLRPSLSVGVLSLIGLIFFGVLSYRLWLAETESLQASFHNEVARQAASFEREVLLNLEILYTLTSAAEVQSPQSQADFERMIANVLERLPAIQAFAWAPWVTAEQRDLFERQYAGSNDSGWLFESAIDGERQAVGDRPWYVPVEFIAPLDANQAAVGFDLASEARRLEALLAAREENRMVATAPIRLVQEPENQRGFLVFTPLYQSSPGVPQERTHYAFLNGVFRIGQLFEQSIGTTVPNNILFQIVDVTLPQPEVMFSSYLPSENTWQLDFTDTVPLSDVAGRRWVVRATPSIGYINDQRGYLPIIVLLSGIGLMALLLAYTLLTLQRNRELHEAKQQLEAISLTDSLTGLANRRHFDQHLEQEWARARRNRVCVSLVMIDIDFFKPYNDEYGHPAGDRCLKQVAEALKGVPGRPADLVARYGGEEFAMILPGADDPEPIAEQCRATIEWLRIPHDYSDISDVITISVGVATLTPGAQTSVRQLTEQADEALYEAKEAGRNRVVVFR
ncbi:MAG: sensor domain-containing diguanylate cyclase [Saccharospirillum sp.]